MQVATTTTNDETELYKALISKKKLKELENVKPFTAQEMIILEPEEGEDAQMMAVLKVDGKYYSGISQEIVQTTLQTISMLNKMEPEKKEAFLGKTKFQITKSSGGRYGKLVLEAI